MAQSVITNNESTQVSGFSQPEGPHWAEESGDGMQERVEFSVPLVYFDWFSVMVSVQEGWAISSCL